MARNTERGKYSVSLLVTVVATMMVIFAAANVSALVYPSGMVGYWKFDGNLTDQMGMYNATMGYYGSYSGGIIDQGLHGAMGCSNPYAAKVDNFPNLDSFTVEAWIKPACPPYSWQGSLTVNKRKETGYYRGIGFILLTNPSPYGSGNYGFNFGMTDGTNGTDIQSNPVTYACDNWYHVVAIRDYGKEIKLFVNGELVASAIDNIVGSIANTEPLMFHGWTSGGCGWGMSALTLDEVAIYNRPLSTEEIQRHYQNGLKGLGYTETDPPPPPPTDKCQQDLTSAQLEIQSLQTQVDTLSAQNTELQNQVSVLNKQITPLQNQIGILTQTNQALQTQVDTLSALNTEFQSQVSALNQQITQLQNQIINLTQQNQALQTQVDTLSTRNAQLQNQASQLTTELVSGLTNLQNDVRLIFNDPAFAIPGTAPAEQYQNLINAIRNLNNGRKEGIYTNLGGKSGRAK
ncbi:MAG: hypothetical protein HYS23_09730 [Geobacter sp.]|nr:hypothetical protein [Geobacter sp.]